MDKMNNSNNINIKDISTPESIKSLILEAFEAQKMAYSPYSNFAVGSALLTKRGNIYKGCNVESVAFSPTNCAERTAIFSAVAQGERAFEAIAIVGASTQGVSEADYCPPCGVCRQVMMEFCNPIEFKIIVAKTVDDYKVYTLDQLLPISFGPNNLG